MLEQLGHGMELFEAPPLGDELACDLAHLGGTATGPIEIAPEAEPANAHAMPVGHVALVDATHGEHRQLGWQNGTDILEVPGAQAAGREVTALLMGTPGWATEGVPVRGVPSGLYLPVHHAENHWANFVRRIVSEHGGRIKHWIIWNDPDIASDHPETVARLLKEMKEFRTLQ